MKNEVFIESLKDFGLSEHEALVYFASLALGPATIQKIAEAAEVKRTTVYTIVESLKQKGLMNIELRGLKKVYSPENPEKLETVLDVKKQKLAKLLPEFSALYNLKGGESFIKYYEGLEASKSVYEGLIQDVKPHDDYLIISDLPKWLNLDKEYFMNFTARRAKLNISIRMLLVDCPEAREFKKVGPNYNFKAKLLPEGMQLTTNLVVIPRRVVIHQLTPPIMAIVIENKSVIQFHRETFEMLWKSLPG